MYRLTASGPDGGDIAGLDDVDGGFVYRQWFLQREMTKSGNGDILTKHPVIYQHAVYSSERKNSTPRQVFRPCLCGACNSPLQTGIVLRSDSPSPRDVLIQRNKLITPRTLCICCISQSTCLLAILFRDLVGDTILADSSDAWPSRTANISRDVPNHTATERQRRRSVAGR